MKKRKGRKKGSKNRKKVEIKMQDCLPEKLKLIKTIWKLQPDMKELDIDLTKYSISQLEKHLTLIQKRTYES